MWQNVKIFRAVNVTKPLILTYPTFPRDIHPIPTPRVGRWNSEVSFRPTEPWRLVGFFGGGIQGSSGKLPCDGKIARSGIPKKIWGFPKMVIPLKHPKMIIFSMKSHGCWVPLFLVQPIWEKRMLGGGNSNSFGIFIPKLGGRWTQFDEHIFQMGWFNHQPVWETYHLGGLFWGFLYGKSIRNSL